jgi:ABC-2 type transport system ATP-binding protein
LIELVELDAKRDTRAATLSGGQRRRLDLALALVGDPDLLFLDEPTTGFDPQARRNAWSTIRTLCDLGKTIFLTTHFMDEAQTLADRVAVMRAGEIIATGTPDELGGRDARPAEIRFGLPSGVALEELPDVPALERSAEGGRVLIRTEHAVRATAQITAWALEHDVELEHFSVSQPTLEDVYLELTGGEQPAADHRPSQPAASMR